MPSLRLQYGQSPGTGLPRLTILAGDLRENLRHTLEEEVRRRYDDILRSRPAQFESRITISPSTKPARFELRIDRKNPTRTPSLYLDLIETVPAVTKPVTKPMTTRPTGAEELGWESGFFQAVREHRATLHRMGDDSALALLEDIVASLKAMPRHQLARLLTDRFLTWMQSRGGNDGGVI